MQLLITPLAAYDLEEIGDYIAQDNPVRAGSFVAELRTQCEKICPNPAGYRRSARSCGFISKEARKTNNHYDLKDFLKNSLARHEILTTVRNY